ncbi:MAG: PDZ domain-containing protein [Gemmatimonadaceae bacterium]
MKTRHTLRAFAALAAIGLAVPALRAQEGECNSCEAEERDRAMRRYQQEIDRARRVIATLERQLESKATTLDSASLRRLNEQMQRAVEQLSRAHTRQAAQLQSLTERAARTRVAIAPPANAWMTQSMDGYIGVLWSASVQVDHQKHGDALWTFHDYPQVEAVERESPAERAGIQVGDVITSFDGKDLRRGRIAMNTVLRPGSTITVRLLREKRPRSVSVRVVERPRTFVRTPAPTPRGPVIAEPGATVQVYGELPESPEAPRTPPPAERPFGELRAPPAPPGYAGLFGAVTVGAEMIELDGTLGEPYGTDYGLLVLQVAPRTPAARAGVQKGDVLIAVNGRELRSVSQLIRAVERAAKDEVRIEVIRKDAKRTVVMRW